MIPLNELTIGSWVQSEQGALYQIKHLGLEFNQDLVYGIPLNDDILRLIGCEQSKNDSEMWRHPVGLGIILTRRHNSEVVFIGGMRSGRYIAYVHEFQIAAFIFTGYHPLIKL